MIQYVSAALVPEEGYTPPQVPERMRYDYTEGNLDRVQ